MTAAGALNLSEVKTKNELPFGSIPIFFGIQQTIEGVVWLSFSYPVLNTIATYIYSIFANVLWPIFIPLSVFLVETDKNRKNILRMFFFVGISVGLYLLYFIFRNSVTSNIVGNSIYYKTPELYTSTIIAIYLIATCGSCLFSSHKIINMFGVIILFSFGIAAWFFIETFLSVWCFFSAILSILVYWHFKNEKHRIY